MWSLHDLSNNPTPVAAPALASATDPRLVVWCGVGAGTLSLAFHAGTPAYRSLQDTLTLLDGKPYRVTFRLDDGRLMVVQARLSLDAAGGASFNILTLPADPGSEAETANRQIDAVLNAVMVQENDFTVRIGDDRATWISPVRFPAQGLSVMWKTAARTAAAGGDNLSAESRAAMAE